MVQRARARETKGRQSPRRRKELMQPVPRKRRRDETQDRVAERLAQLRTWADTWPSADPPCTKIVKRRKVGKQPDDTGAVVASNREYAVVAQPPAYVAARIRVLEKHLVVDHASLCCEQEEFTNLSVEDWCNIASVEPDSKGLAPTQETLAAVWNASAFTLCLVHLKSREVVGYVYAALRTDSNQLIISHVKVDAAERGKRLGTLMIEAAEVHAKGRGWKYESCKLEVMESNVAAKRCYSRSGFRHIKSGYRTHTGCSLRWELWRKVVGMSCQCADIQ